MESEVRRIHSVKEINYPLLGIVLFLAILCADLVGSAIKWKFAAMSLEAAAIQMEKENQDMQTRLATEQMKREAQAREQEKVNKAIREQEKRRIENNQNAHKTDMETCKFWISKYNQERSQYNLAYKQMACDKLGIH